MLKQPGQTSERAPSRWHSNQSKQTWGILCCPQCRDTEGEGQALFPMTASGTRDLVSEKPQTLGAVGFPHYVVVDPMVNHKGSWGTLFFDLKCLLICLERW